jgi:hypothetical protein
MTNFWVLWIVLLSFGYCVGHGVYVSCVHYDGRFPYLAIDVVLSVILAAGYAWFMSSGQCK